MQYDKEQLKKELIVLKERKELFSAQLHQICGAVAIIESMINTLNSSSLENELENHHEKEQGNNNQDEEKI